MALNENIMIRLMADTSNYTAKMQAASASAEKLGTAIEKPMTANERFKAGAMKAGLAVGALSLAVGVAAVKSFMDFDASMSMVQANTGATGKELNKLRDAALEAGARTVYSATESADAINELAKAGMSTSDILNGGLNGALDLAASDGMAVSEAAELMSSTLSQFNLTGKDATKVADALAAGAGKAQGDAKDLGYALSQSGMVANSFGISMQETTGTLASFASAGMIGSDAGTSLKSMLIALANPSKKAQQTMDDLGISAYDAQGNFVGLSGLAGILKDKMSGLTVEQRNQALATIFGTDAVRAANVLYNQGADGIDSWTKAVSDSGFAAKQAAARNDNLKGDLEQLSGAVETMLIKIGSGANGPFRSLVQNVTNVINAFGSLDPKIQQSTVLVGMGIGAFAGLHKMFGNLSTSSSGFSRGLGLVLDPVQRFQSAVPKLSAGLGDLSGAFRGPEKGVGLMADGMTRGQTATRGLKSMGGGLLDMLGGPWGAAFTGAAIVLDIYAQKQADAKARTEAFTSALQSGSSATKILQNNLKTGENTDWGWFQKLRTGADSLSGALDKAGISQKTFIAAAQGNKAAIAQMNGEMDDYIYMQGGAGTVTDEIRAKVDQQSKAYKAAKEAVKEQAKADQEATEARVKQTKALASGTDASAKNAAASTDVASADDLLADKTQNAKDAIDKQASALKSCVDALKKYYGYAETADEANADLEQSYDDAAKAIKENGRSVDKTGNSLDVTTEKGRNNLKALTGIRDSALDMASAYYAAGYSSDDIAKKTQQARDAFIRTAQQMGLNSKAANALADKYGLIPDEVVTAVSAPGADGAKGAVDRLRQSITITPSRKVISVGAPGALTAAGQIKQAADQLMRLGNKTVHVSFSSDGMPVIHRANGGLITGPGTATSDSIPARLSNGEYVLRAAAVKAVGRETLDAINYQRYANGGYVQKAVMPNYASNIAMAKPRVVYHQPITIKEYAVQSPGVQSSLTAQKIRMQTRNLLGV